MCGEPCSREKLAALTSSSDPLFSLFLFLFRTWTRSGEAINLLKPCSVSSNAMGIARDFIVYKLKFILIPINSFGLEIN